MCGGASVGVCGVCSVTIENEHVLRRAAGAAVTEDHGLGCPQVLGAGAHAQVSQGWFLPRPRFLPCSQPCAPRVPAGPSLGVPVSPPLVSTRCCRSRPHPNDLITSVRTHLQTSHILRFWGHSSTQKFWGDTIQLVSVGDTTFCDPVHLRKPKLSHLSSVWSLCPGTRRGQWCAECLVAPVTAQGARLPGDKLQGSLCGIQGPDSVLGRRACLHRVT